MLTHEQEIQQQTLLTAAHHDYEKKLILHAFFRLDDRTLSEDLVQETFMKTWSYLVRGGKIVVMKAFLYHLLNNLIVDEYRKHKTTSLDDLREKGFEPKDGHFRIPADVLDDKAVLLLIQRLPQPYHGVMRMKYVQDLTLLEISSITGQSKETVAVQVHRGLEKLKLLHNPV